MAKYTSANRTPIIKITDVERLGNQVIMTGTDESHLVEQGYFFLEYLEADGVTTVSILDGNGTSIATGVSAFNNDRSPLRCDGGIEIVGDVSIAKGFYINGAYLS